MIVISYYLMLFCLFRFNVIVEEFGLVCKKFWERDSVVEVGDLDVGDDAGSAGSALPKASPTLAAARPRQ